MSGMKHNPLGDVEMIRQLLSGYESGFPFLKEMVQNANDARAKKLVIQWNKGKIGEHPLLQCPSLLILNDGPFDKESRDGIEMIGLSNRAADTDRIGRFGLGIKSLFHICEAFFFLESDGKENLRNLLTPWHGSSKENTEHHREWWDVSKSDWDALHESISQTATKYAVNPWFAIWVPLRSQSHLAGIPPLRHDLPGDEESCPDLIKKAFLHESPSLAESMIFLSEVKDVFFDNGKTSHPIERKQDSQKNGLMILGRSRCKVLPVSSGDKSMVDELQLKEFWPTISDRKSTKQVPDKAKWEGGVAVSLTPVAPNGSAKLRLFWNVFLPVGNKPVFEGELDGLDDDVHLFLHGYFFPNRDRTEVMGANDGFKNAGEGSEEALKILWNKELAASENGVLCLLPELLYDRLKAEGFTDYKIQVLVKTLRNSNWFRMYRDAVCLKNAIVRCLKSGRWEWHLVDAKLPALVFPCFGKQQQEVESFLQTLIGDNKANRLILVEGIPYLRKSDSNTDWNEEDFECFFDPLKNVVLHQEDHRKYVRSLLQKFSTLAEENPELWECLPLYEVVSLAGSKRIVSAKELGEQEKKQQLFKNPDQKKLKEALREACPKADAWFLLDQELPPTISPASFSCEKVAGLILAQEGLAISPKRTALVEELLLSVDGAEPRSAIRYLIHGKFDHREFAGVLYLGTKTQWDKVIEKVLNFKDEAWRQADDSFGKIFNDDQKKKLDVSACGRDAFQKLCSSENAKDYPLSEDHDFLLKELAEDTPELLKRLKIHRLGDGQFTVMDDQTWLEPEKGKEKTLPSELNPIWKKLCSDAKIVCRCRDRVLESYQGKLFVDRILDTSGVIALACQQKQPDEYAELILHQLASGTPSGEAFRLAKTVAWLPLHGGQIAKLEKLLCIDGAEDALEKIAQYRSRSSGVILRSEIQLNFEKNKKAWNTIRTHFVPKEDDAFELLKKAFESESKLHFGLSNLTGSELGEWLRIVEGMEDAISPAVNLIRALWPGEKDEEKTKGEKEKWAEKLATVFAKKWSNGDAKRYDPVLEGLRDGYSNDKKNNQKSVLKFFHQYLSAAVESGRWQNAYRNDPKFLLLNQEEGWTPIGKLVVPIAGIARRALVHQETVKTLDLDRKEEGKDSLPGAEIDHAENDLALANLLKDYGEKLSECLPPMLWGVWVALLGDGKNVRELANQLTGGRVDAVRDELCANVKGWFETRQKVTENCYVCSLTSGKTTKVRAINGCIFDAPLDQNQTSFLVAQHSGGEVDQWKNRFFVKHEFEDREDEIYYSFRLYDPTAFAKDKLAQIMKRLEYSINLLLKEAIRVDDRNLGKIKPFLEKFMELGQMSLGRAQHEILATAQIHLSQLGIRPEKGTELAKAIQCLDDATSLSAQASEEKENDFGDPNQREKEAQEKRDEGHKQLRHLFEQDGSVQNQLLQAMRLRIEREQYKPESVPFELFQNADDALAQLPQDTVNAPMVFVVQETEDRIRIAHWGRPINDPCGTEDELKRSYERDLVKMLILHGSDKQGDDSDAGITGKFGLGFKSIYLVTDIPRILSGELAFDVAGAIYPRRLNPEEKNELANCLKEMMPAQTRGTIIEIKATAESRMKLKRFQELAPYLAIFARKIRDIRIEGSSPLRSLWKPKRIYCNETWEVWIGDNPNSGRLLHIKAGESSWLFRLGSKGLQKLEGVPCLWATAPLHSCGSVGFALNAPFDPDPGRTELGKGNESEKKNRELLNQSSAKLADFFTWCFETDDLLEKLELLERSIENFWKSVWELFSKMPKDGGEVDRLFECVWPKDAGEGYAKVVKTHPVIPNGMVGRLAVLTSLEKIQFQTDGYLASNAARKLWESLPDWEAWKGLNQKIEAENIVSDQVAELLKSNIAGFEAEPLSLDCLIQELAGKDRNIDARLCGQLGEYVHSGIFDKKEDNHTQHSWDRTEEEKFKESIKKLHFLNQGGKWVSSADLLIRDSSEAESLRAAIAPDERVLHESYSKIALKFFHLCRGDQKVKAQEIAEWIKDALKHKDEKRIGASLKFLASTENKMPIEVSEYLEGADRESIQAHPEFKNLSKEDQNRVTGAFSQADGYKARKEGRDPNALTLPLDFPQKNHKPPITLEDIVNAWKGNKKKALRQLTVSGIYCELVFLKTDTSANLGEQLRQADTLAGKEAWFRLLCLGCLLGIPLGRNPETQILPFWSNRLDQEFWAATIPTTLEKADASGFDQKLDGFFEKIIHQTFRDINASGEKAEFWRRVFYDFRKMNHLVFRDDLPSVLLQIADAPETNGNTLLHFLRSGWIPESMQEAGRVRWSGVIGQSMNAPLFFVMRELRRLEVLPAERFDCACYYVNSPVKRVAIELGWIGDEERRNYDFENTADLSERIYNEVCSSEYKDELLPYLDLPFQWYARTELK